MGVYVLEALGVSYVVYLTLVGIELTSHPPPTHNLVPL